MADVIGYANACVLLCRVCAPPTAGRRPHLWMPLRNADLAGAAYDQECDECGLVVIGRPPRVEVYPAFDGFDPREVKLLRGRFDRYAAQNGGWAVRCERITKTDEAGRYVVQDVDSGTHQVGNPDVSPAGLVDLLQWLDSFYAPSTVLRRRSARILAQLDRGGVVEWRGVHFNPDGLHQSMLRELVRLELALDAERSQQVGQLVQALGISVQDLDGTGWLYAQTPVGRVGNYATVSALFGAIIHAYDQALQQTKGSTE